MRPKFHSCVAKRVWQTFLALAGEVASTGDLIQRVWPRKRRFDTKEYRRVRLAAAEIADPVGRASSKGRPILWRLREPVE
jgi:hypothetical protein